MKKFALLLVTAIAFLSSCDNDNGDYWISDEIAVPSRKWVLVGGVNEIGSFFEYIHEDRRIDNKMYNYGTIDVYLYQYSEDGSEVQIKLPYTQHFGEGNLRWSRTIDFDYTVGSLAIYVTYSNFVTQYRPTDIMEFRMAMHRPD